MGILKKTILPILFAGIWINMSETFRWVFLVKAYWVNHYQQMNILFPDEMLNIVVWMIWGFLYAIAIYIISQKFNLMHTTVLAWFMAFVLLWIILWNINMLPLGILIFVIPMSFFETFVAVLICKRLTPDEQTATLIQ